MCRAKKEWPPYFTLSINELPGMGDDNGRNQVNLPASVTSFISDKLLFDRDDDEDKRSVSSIGSSEAVMFINPCNYTLEVDEEEYGGGVAGGEISAFDPDHIEEESSDKQKLLTKSRDELEKQVRTGVHKLDEAHIKSELVLGFRDKQ